MSSTPAFYSVNEVAKPAAKRVHHNHNSCPPGSGSPARAVTGCTKTVIV